MRGLLYAMQNVSPSFNILFRAAKPVGSRVKIPTSDINASGSNFKNLLGIFSFVNSSIGNDPWLSGEILAIKDRLT